MAWVVDYNGEEVRQNPRAAREILLRVMHTPDDIPIERIPVSECGKLRLTDSVMVDEEIYPDGSVHIHLHKAS